ncbi:MAG: hypothetical protein QM655_05825, partial [Nocardioidaceae bacterium]
MTLQGLSRGSDPAIDWIDGRTLHLAGGGTTALPRAYHDVAAYHGGWLALRSDAQGNTVLDTIDSSGAVTKTVPSTWGFAYSPDRTLLAWVKGDRIVRDTVSGEAKVSVQAEAGGEPSVFGMTAEGQVLYTVNAAHSRVFRTDFQAPSGLWGAIHGGGVSSTGAVSDMYKSMDDGSCSEV